MDVGLWLTGLGAIGSVVGAYFGWKALRPRLRAPEEVPSAVGGRGGGGLIEGGSGVIIGGRGGAGGGPGGGHGGEGGSGVIRGGTGIIIGGEGGGAGQADGKGGKGGRAGWAQFGDEYLDSVPDITLPDGRKLRDVMRTAGSGGDGASAPQPNQ